jgi:ribosomal protein S27AE
MRFTETVVQEITNRLSQLGLEECPICHSGTLVAHHIPVLLPIGGRKSVIEDPVNGDPDTNVLFMVRVACEVCGYTLLFDSEKHHGQDVPVLEPAPGP